MDTCAMLIMTLILLFIWDLLGQLGFSIWRENNIIIYNSLEKLSTYKIRFRLAGPAGLAYALNRIKAEN